MLSELKQINDNMSQNNEDNDLISDQYLESKIYIKEERLQYYNQDE